MKNLKAMMLVAVVAIAITGCAKLEKVLPKGDGVWKVTSETVVEYENGTQVSSTTTPTDSLGTFTFNSDGTGKTSYPGQADETFNWSTNADGDQIIITETGSSFALTIEVLESKSKTQKWFYAVEFSFGTDTYRSEVTMELERQ